MSTIDLLNGLNCYRALLSTLKDRVMTDKPERSEFIQTVSLSYLFITLTLTMRNPEEDRPGKVYLTCSYQTSPGKVSLVGFHCDDPSKVDDLKAFTPQHAPRGVLSETIESSRYSSTVSGYLRIADEIAKEAFACAPGDDYSPGYYSKIVVEEDRIILSQINRHNARSRDHKDDYHMRDLEFIIPLTNQFLKPRMADHEIGGMIVNFSDHSSKQNQVCGDRIKIKIAEEKMKFGK